MVAKLMAVIRQRFAGCHVRRPAASDLIFAMAPSHPSDAYREAGVDIDRAAAFVDDLKPLANAASAQA